jgi:hypothetical protein
VNTIKHSGKIDQHLDLIAGLPEEDYDSFRQTFNEVFALRPEELQLGFLKMLRGTGMRRDAHKYGYVYMDQAPYEILGNEQLPFADVVRIKRVEDVLEKYWNAHRMDHTVEYLIEHVFESPFDFFQQFGDYWEAQGWQKIGHQLEDLFTRLHEFLSTLKLTDFPVVEGLMKLDYFMNHKYKPRKSWWTFSMDKADHHAFMQTLLAESDRVSGNFAQLGLSEKELHKHSMIERIPFDLETYWSTGEIRSGSESLLIVYYSPDAGGASAYALYPIYSHVSI